jgi:hypothetical protein
MSAGGVTDMVRKFAEANTTIRKRQVREALGLSVDQVSGAIDTLRRQGWLQRVGHGVYQFQEQRLNDRESPIQDKLWRAMRINPTFTPSDLARQCGTTRNYANKMMRIFRGEGLVERAGTRATPAGYWERQWRLTPKGRDHRERPEVSPWRPDPLVQMTVELNRLVCTGMAVRDKASADRASQLCASITSALQTGGANG